MPRHSAEKHSAIRIAGASYVRVGNKLVGSLDQPNAAVASVLLRFMRRGLELDHARRTFSIDQPQVRPRSRKIPLLALALGAVALGLSQIPTQGNRAAKAACSEVLAVGQTIALQSPEQRMGGVSLVTLPARCQKGKLRATIDVVTRRVLDLKLDLDA